MTESKREPVKYKSHFIPSLPHCAALKLRPLSVSPPHSRRGLHTSACACEQPLPSSSKRLPAHLHASSTRAHVFYSTSFFPLLFTLPSPVTPVLSRLISSSPVLPHSRLASIYFTRQRAGPPTLCPTELNWSMEIDLLKYLLWNLLCDDNSRPLSMPSWEESQAALIFLLGEEKKHAIKVNFPSFEM